LSAAHEVPARRLAPETSHPLRPAKEGNICQFGAEKSIGVGPAAWRTRWRGTRRSGVSGDGTAGIALALAGDGGDGG